MLRFRVEALNEKRSRKARQRVINAEVEVLILHKVENPQRGSPRVALSLKRAGVQEGRWDNGWSD